MSRFRNLTTALAAMLLVGAPTLRAADFQSGDTKMSVYGFVWVYANYYVDAIQQQDGFAGSMFYNVPSYLGGSASPMDTHANANNQFLFTVQPTRFGFASVTPSANLGDIKTKIEYDVNGSNDHLRLAQIQVGGFTIGQAWSLWNDFDASVDTVDWAGPVGAPCFDTPRYMLIRYDAQLDKQNSLAISLENDNGNGDGSYDNGNTSAGQKDYKIPTIIAAYAYTDSWGHLSVRGIMQNYGVEAPATPTMGIQRYSKEEAAFMLSGDFKIAKDDLVFNIYTGNALGNYGMGYQSVLFTDKTQTVTAFKQTGWAVGYTHNWTDAVRSNIILSGISFSSDTNLPSTQSPAPVGDPGMKTGYSFFLNTFVKLAKNLEFGVEYIYEQAKPFATTFVGGAPTTVDKNDQPQSKNSNSKIEFSLKANF